ncbi:hypothetical protein M1M98_00035 [Thermodesulfovibrionales bacterium]|nr:hypothetical protein [Thermodesulfovibrionales bacterium]
MLYMKIFYHKTLLCLACLIIVFFCLSCFGKKGDPVLPYERQEAVGEEILSEPTEVYPPVIDHGPYRIYYCICVALYR